MCNCYFANNSKVDDEDRAAQVDAEKDDDTRDPELGDLEDEGGGDANANAGKATKKKKYTKADLYKAYKGRGPCKMTLDFLRDPALKRHCVIIPGIADPLEKFYNESLKRQQDGIPSMLQWAADRCTASEGSYWRVVCDILTRQHDRYLHQDMHLVPPTVPPVSRKAEWIKDDLEALKTMSELAGHLAACVLWGQLMFTMALPHAAAFFVSKHGDQREQGMSMLRPIIEAVLAAYKASLVAPEVGECIDDLGWLDQVLPQEIIIMVLASNFDPHDKELRKLMVRFYSSSNTTKDVLESCFNTLKDRVDRQSKNKKASPWLVWFYSTASRYGHESVSGMKQVEVNASDWLKARNVFSDRQSLERQRFFEAFKLDSTKMPTGENVPFPKTSKGAQKTKWRNSGPLSHYVSSASAAYLIHDCPKNFENAGRAWTGLIIIVLFVTIYTRKQVFSQVLNYNSENKFTDNTDKNLLATGSFCSGVLFATNGYFADPDGDIWLSLGFRKWAAAGVKVQPFQVGGEDWQSCLSLFCLTCDSDDLIS